MSYSTPFDVRAAVNPNGGTDDPPDDLTHTAADLSNGEIQNAIDEADSTIDSFIGSRYPTPVALVAGAVPHPLDYWSRNIAAYNATLTQRGSADFADTDPIARRYNATMLVLTAVRDGKAQIPNMTESGAGATGEGAGAGSPYNQYTGSLFDADDFSLVPELPGWRTGFGQFGGGW